jgi:Fe-S-cluster containining protein
VDKRVLFVNTYLYRILTNIPYLETGLDRIATLSTERTAENDRFIVFLKEKGHQEIDLLVQTLNQAVTARIDCTTCGNCCKSLMINVSEAEADRLSAHFRQDRPSFDAQYLEKGSNGMMLLNAIPCHFLVANKCTVYEHRFEGCREFPAMHLPHFKSRLFTTFMHYGRCPIIFNVVEQLKEALTFEKDDD